MSSSGNWSPYVGSSAIVLAIVLFIITGLLVYLAMQLRHPVTVKRPGAALGVLVVAIWFLAGITFLVSVAVYGRALQEQMGHASGATDPITPVTDTLILIIFIVIAYLTRRRGFWIAFGSAIAGTVAAPLIFELPFDLIVMWHTYPPEPHVLFTLLFFLPLLLVELLSFAVLLLSPAVAVTRYTLFFLAAMFLVFALWALTGFAYPLTPLPTMFNIISKIIAFIVAATLFLPQAKVADEKVVGETVVHAEVGA